MYRLWLVLTLIKSIGTIDSVDFIYFWWHMAVIDSDKSEAVWILYRLYQLQNDYIYYYLMN